MVKQLSRATRVTRPIAQIAEATKNAAATQHMLAAVAESSSIFDRLHAEVDAVLANIRAA